MAECLGGDWALVVLTAFFSKSTRMAYDPTSKFQKLQIGFDLTFMRDKIKICKTDFSQNRKM